MADLPELQRRLLERSQLLGFEPYADAPMRVRDRPSSAQDSGSGDDGEEACAVEAPVSRPRGKTSASRSPDHDPPEPDRLGNTRWPYRYIGYRQLAHWLWGRLGQISSEGPPCLCCTRNKREISI
ncbi:hypothetical protein MRX96_009625 [Rhipicephalus microplus]